MQPNFEQPGHACIGSHFVHDDRVSPSAPAYSNSTFMLNPPVWPPLVHGPPAHDVHQPYPPFAFPPALFQQIPMPSSAPPFRLDYVPPLPPRKYYLTGPGRFDRLNADPVCSLLLDEQGALDVHGVGCGMCGRYVNLYGTEEAPYKTLSRWEGHREKCAAEVGSPRSTKRRTSVMMVHPFPMAGWQEYLSRNQAHQGHSQ